MESNSFKNPYFSEANKGLWNPFNTVLKWLELSLMAMLTLFLLTDL